MRTQTKRTNKKATVAPISPSEELVRNWRQTQRPIVITVNDTLTLHVNDDRSVHLLAHLVERLESIAAIRDGLRDVDEGRTVSFEEFQAKARAKHGLQD
jgi:hypothetical protein